MSKMISFRIPDELDNRIKSACESANMKMSPWLISIIEAELASTGKAEPIKPVSKRIDTPVQAKEAVKAIPIKKDLAVDERKQGILAAMESVTMSISEAKALRFNQSLLK